MEKIDQHIKESAQTHEPNPQFVADTMQKIEAVGTPRKYWVNWKVLAPAAGGLAVVAVAVIMFTPHFTGTTANTATSGDVKSKTDIQAQAAVNAPIDPTNTTDVALDSDLSSVQASLSQSASDQSAADSSINDSQQQISIPTE